MKRELLKLFIVCFQADVRYDDVHILIIIIVYAVLMNPIKVIYFYKLW